MKPFHIRSILVATDLLDSSAAVLTTAADLAERLGAEVHVLHALQMVTSYSAMSAADEVQRRFQSARDALDDQVRHHFAERIEPRSRQVKMGATPGAILDRAREVDADLIVMGPATPRPFRGPILGNTTDHVIQSAQAPVLVVRERLAPELRSVVVPLDVAHPARGAIDHAIAWACTMGGSASDRGLGTAELRAFYVIPSQYAGGAFPFDEVVAGPQLRLEVEDARERTGAPANLRVREDLAWGDEAAEEVVRYVAADPADLLVLGTHGYGAIGRALIGSVTSRIVRTAVCPMLLVPPSLAAITAAPRR